MTLARRFLHRLPMPASDIFVLSLYALSLLCALLSAPVRWFRDRHDRTFRHLRISFGLLGAAGAFLMLARIARWAFE